MLKIILLALVYFIYICNGNTYIDDNGDCTWFSDGGSSDGGSSDGGSSDQESKTESKETEGSNGTGYCIRDPVRYFGFEDNSLMSYDGELELQVIGTNIQVVDSTNTHSVTCKIGNKCVYLGGTETSRTNYLKVRDYSGTLNLGGGDWTVELWVHPLVFYDSTWANMPGEGYTRLFCSRLLCESISGAPYNYDLNPTTHPAWMGQFILNEWNHVAIVGKDEITSFYVNGQRTGSVVTADYLKYSSPYTWDWSYFEIGAETYNPFPSDSIDSDFNGFIDGLAFYDYAKYDATAETIEATICPGHFL